MTAEDLSEEFGRFGGVASAHVEEHAGMALSCGCAVVVMLDGADEALRNLDGSLIQGRKVSVYAG